TPSAPVTTCVGATLPAPVVGMRKCTVAPATGALFASVTSTAGGVATASPSTASWSSPARMAILAADAQVDHRRVGRLRDGKRGEAVEYASPSRPRTQTTGRKPVRLARQEGGG